MAKVRRRTYFSSSPQRNIFSRSSCVFSPENVERRKKPKKKNKNTCGATSLLPTEYWLSPEREKEKEAKERGGGRERERERERGPKEIES